MNKDTNDILLRRIALLEKRQSGTHKSLADLGSLVKQGSENQHNALMGLAELQQKGMSVLSEPVFRNVERLERLIEIVKTHQQAVLFLCNSIIKIAEKMDLAEEDSKAIKAEILKHSNLSDKFARVVDAQVRTILDIVDEVGQLKKELQENKPNSPCNGSGNDTND
ncbi:MAG: hypothetical protein OXI24_13430 [Candidatus Poribacteria bacterium]|nr:hypothetical protein [Candidatus Poribacteria bacterium]